MKTSSFIQALRPINLWMAAVIMFAVRIGLLGITHTYWTYWLGFSAYVFSVLCIMAFGYLINDYYDVKTDAINKPGKNIFEGKTSRLPQQSLIWLPVIAVVIPVCISLAGLSLAPVGLNSLACILLMVYAQKGKNSIVWGNLMVSFLSALLIYSALLTSSREIKITADTIKIISLYAVFSFMSTWVREIVKDAEDEEGDRLAGIKTLATQKGLNVAIHWASVVLLALELIIIVSIFSLFHANMVMQIAFSVLAVTGFFILFKLRKSRTKGDFKQLSIWLKVFMAMGIITMIL